MTPHGIDVMAEAFATLLELRERKAIGRCHRWHSRLGANAVQLTEGVWEFMLVIREQLDAFGHPQYASRGPKSTGRAPLFQRIGENASSVE